MVKPTRGKSRALRIPLSFHARSDGLERWRHGLTAIAILLTTGLVIAFFVSPGMFSTRSYSPGPVSAAHAPWENNCAQCHADFAPQRNNAVKLGPRGHAAEATVWGQLADQKCRQCHPVKGIDPDSLNQPFALAQHAPGGPGRATESRHHVAGCATCHREHPVNGRLGDIVSVTNEQCVRCHQDLDRITAEGSPSPSVHPRISHFADGDHPKFGSLDKKRQRAIKFTHGRHMAVGLWRKGSRGEKLTWAEAIPNEAAREPYLDGGKDKNDLVQLDCASCHPGPLAGGDSSTMAGGVDILMPNFDNHCKACHQLDFIPGSTNPQDLMAHGLTPSEMRRALNDVFGTDDSTPFLQPSRGRRPIPGKSRPTQPRKRSEGPSLAMSESHLTKRCLQCHFRKPGDSSATLPNLRPLPWSRSSTASPILSKSRFDHRVHALAKMDCAGCHDIVESQAGDAPRDGTVNGLAATGVTIPNLDNCLQCHTSGDVQPQRVKGPTNCVACHTYHGASSDNKQQPLVIENTPKKPEIRFPLGQEPAANSNSSIDWSGDSSFVGVSSCSAAGCHGGDSERFVDTEAWKSSYSTWLRNDPHATAFTTLWNAQSKAIVEQLAWRPLSKGDYQEFLRDQCIGCHSSTHRDRDPDGSVVADGVSCETCHGGAKDWVRPHTLATWQGSGHGFVDMNDTKIRSATCVRCHVGGRVVAGRTFDVNHDLIAAGHPRLRFEFAAYMANYPSHWNNQPSIDSQTDSSRRRSTADESESYRWLVGRKATAVAALKQLGNRAANTSRSVHNSPWPEFAEYDCASCHHDLDPESSSAKQSMSWATWHFTEWDESWLFATPDNLRSLKTAMSTVAPDAHRVSDLCRTLANSNDRLVTEDSLSVLRSFVLYPSVEPSWDELAQWRLAAAALLEQMKEDDSVSDAIKSIEAEMTVFHRALDYPFSKPSPTVSRTACVESQQRLQARLSRLFESDRE